jgi:hypothetical protein
LTRSSLLRQNARQVQVVPLAYFAIATAAYRSDFQGLGCTFHGIRV